MAIEFIKIPEVGLVALNPLGRTFPGVTEEIQSLASPEEYGYNRHGELTASPETLHILVAALGQNQNKKYTLPTISQYKRIFEWAKQNNPKLLEDMLQSDDTLNARITMTRKGRKLHEGFGYRKEKGLWRLMKETGTYSEIPKEIYTDNLSAHEGVIAVRVEETKEKELYGIVDFGVINPLSVINPVARIIQN